MPSATERAKSPQFLHLQTTTSTQDALLDKILAGPELQWHVVLADEQTQGRGTRAREWVSSADPNAQLILSFGGRMPSTFSQLPFHGLSLIVGESLWLTLQAMGLGTRQIFLKWPNDLMLQDTGAAPNWRKLGGVLCEFKKNCLLMGVGINISSAPAEIKTAASLIEADSNFDLKPNFREVFSLNLFSHFGKAFECWHQDSSLYMQQMGERLIQGPMRELVGSRVLVKKSHQQAQILGLDPQGFLLVLAEGESIPRCIKSSDEISFYQFAPA